MNTRIYSITPTWRDRIREIKSAYDELRENSSIMNEYQRTIIERRIKDMKTAYYPVIVSGLLAENRDAVQTLKNAKHRTISEKQKEINSWDAQKLTTEMQLQQMLVDQSFSEGNHNIFNSDGTVGNLEKIFNDAQQSGDKYKMRAVAEVMKSLPNKTNSMEDEIKFAGNHLANESKKLLQSIRITPEMVKANEGYQQAYDEYRTVRQEIIKTSYDIGEGDPLGFFKDNELTRAIKQVQIVDDEVMIFETDAPEVTGVIAVKEV
jgi:hypothetical protein